MTLGPAVQVRLELEKRLRYEAEAAAQGVPLGTYLRNRLDAEDVVLDELRLLRRAVERMTDEAKNGAGQSSTVGFDGMTGVLIEMLLTLRQMGGSKSDLAQQEVKRLGLNTWSSNK